MNNRIFMTGGPQDHQLRGHFTHSDNLVIPLQDTQGSGEYHIPVNQGIGPLLKRHINEPAPPSALIPYHLGSFRPLRILPNGLSDPLRTGCWLYLFRNGYLWREIRTPQDERYIQLFDVNLNTWHGKDQRLATCPGSEKIAIPYRINHLTPEYRLIFSEIQLTWDQLEALGGLHPDDPRNPDGQDQQTPDTLEQLSQRSSLLTLIDNLGQVHVESLLGPDQPQYAEPTQPSNWEQAYLYIADPLQDARDLKAAHNEQLGLLAHCIESRQHGPVALAELIENLTANGDPNKLVKHLNRHRPDLELLQATQALEDQLPDRILAAEMALFNYLQTHELALQTHFSDYLTDHLDHQEIGLSHLNQLLMDCSQQKTLNWLYAKLNNPAEANTLWYAAQGNNEALMQRLRQRANGELPPLTADHPLLQSQQHNDPQLIATLTSNLLISLIENHDLALGHHYQQDSVTLMAAVANRFQKLSGIAVKIVQETRLGDWLPEAIQPQSSRGYRYLPNTLIQQLRNLSNKTLPQIIPEGHASLKEFLRTIDTTREGNLQTLKVFGPLLMFNAIVAINQSIENPTTGNSLEHYSATASLVKFVSDRLQRMYPDLNQSKLIQTKKNRHRIDKIAIIKNVLIGSIRILFRLINLATITTEIALSGWHFLRGNRTGNLGVMTTSGLALMGGLLMLVAAPLALTPLFWIGLLTGLGAALIRPWLEYNALEAAIRFSWLGDTPYPKDDSCPFEAPALPNWQEQQENYLQTLQWLARDTKLYARHHEALADWPDLSAELDAIMHPLFNFSASIQLLQPGEYRPFGKGTRLEPLISRQQEILVELRVDLGQFTPFDSLIKGHINLGSRRFNLDETWIHEDYRDPTDPPRTVSFYLRVPAVELLHDISARLWLDLDGQGQQVLPSQDGLLLRYNPASNPNERRIHTLPQTEWEQLLRQARYAPAQERSARQHSLAETLQQASILPLFNDPLQGVH